MPPESRILIHVFACVFVASGVVGCASGVGEKKAGGETSSNSPFAKSLREADPTKQKGPATGDVKSAASSGSEFKLPGRRVYIEYADGKLNRKMALVNRSAPDASQVISGKSDKIDAYVKVAGDDLMADFCEALRRLDFSTVADMTAPRGETPQWTITYDIDGAKKIVSYVRGRDTETLTKCINIQGTFLTAYNRVYGLRTVETGKGGKELFDDEKKHLQQVNQTTLKKAGDKP